MGESIDFQLIAQSIRDALKEHVEGVVGRLRQDLDQYLQKIAGEAAKYALKAAAGDESAKEDLEHLRLQAGLIGAIIFVREQAQAVETFKTLVIGLAKVLIPIARAHGLPIPNLEGLL
jgi:hypothetical protein